MLGRPLDDGELFPDAAQRLAAACEIQRLPDPLGDRHVARTRHALNLSILRILQNHLQSLSHSMSLFDSYP